MTEIELKFQVPAARRAALGKAVATTTAKRIVLRARYFDTSDRRLGRAGLALRVRKEGRRWVQTLKGAGDGIWQRLEHEVPLRPAPGVVPAADPALHDGTPAGDALRQVLGDGELLAIYGTEVTRTQRLLRAPGCVVELAFDQGALTAGDRRWPLCELEFELKGGDATALVALAARWVQRFGLTLDTRTKAERGDRLARGETVAPLPEFETLPQQAPFGARVAALLRPVLALAAEVADEQATPAHQVALTRGMSDLAGLLREAGVEPWLSDTATLLAGLAFEPGAWRLADTQRLWLALIGFTLPDEAEAPSAAS